MRFQNTLLLTGLCALAFAPAASAQTYSPIILTGYTADGIADYDPNSFTDTPANTTNATLDGSGHILYQQGLNPNMGFTNLGVPTNLNTTANLTSTFNPNVTYTLQPAAGNNLLFLHGTGDTIATEPAVGTLTLTTPTAYTNLAFIFQGYDASVPGTYTLNFANGTSAAAAVFTANDWFSTNNVASIGVDRATRTSTPAFDNNTTNPTFHEVDVTVPTAFQNLALASVTFNDTDVVSDHAIGVYAISGVAAVPEPSTWAALLTGAALFGLVQRLRRSLRA